MIRASSEVKNDSKDNETYDGDNFDRAVMQCNHRYASVSR